MLAIRRYVSVFPGLVAGLAVLISLVYLPMHRSLAAGKDSVEIFVADAGPGAMATASSGVRRTITFTYVSSWTPVAGSIARPP